MDIILILRKRETTIRLTRRYGRMHMLGRRFGGDLVEMDHAAAITRQCINIVFDPCHNGVHRPFLQEGRIDAGGDEGIVIIGKRLYPFRPDIMQIGIQDTQKTGAALEFLGKKTKGMNL